MTSMYRKGGLVDFEDGGSLKNEMAPERDRS